MPGYKAFGMRFLDPEKGVPAKNIGTDQLFHRIQDPGVTDQVVEPLEQQVGFVPLGRFE